MKQEQQSRKGVSLATRENFDLLQIFAAKKNYSTHLLISPAMQTSTNRLVQNVASPVQSNSAM